MDQKTITAGGMITGTIVILCGLMVSPVAIGMVLSYPNEIWWLGLVLCGACGLMIAGGIQSIRKSKKAEWQAKQEQERIKEDLTELALFQKQFPDQNGMKKNFPRQREFQPATALGLPHRSEILVHWTFSSAEWKKFMMLERKQRRSSTFYESLAVLVFGTLVIMYARGSAFWPAFWVSLFIALLVAALRYALTMNSFGSVLPVNTVTITDQSVLINNKLNPYRSENYWLDKVQILDGDPDVMEITYAWNTRKGKTFEEMRIPIPPGKKVEALEVMQKMINPTARKNT